MRFLVLSRPSATQHASTLYDTCSHSNPAVRRRIYNQAQAHMWRQAWHVNLYYSDFTVAHQRSLRGLRVLKNFSTHFSPARLT